MTTKQRCEEIIDQLADKTLSFGCVVDSFGKKVIAIIDDEVMAYVPWEIDFDFHHDSLEHIEEGNIKVLGHPIYLHRVLALCERGYYTRSGIPMTKIYKEDSRGGRMWLEDLDLKGSPKDPLWRNAVPLIFLWDKCGIENSLQQIVEESGWERKPWYGVTPLDGKKREPRPDEEQLKSPEARALFEYLDSLFPKHAA